MRWKAFLAVLKVWRRHGLGFGHVVLAITVAALVKLMGEHGCWKVLGAAMRMCWDAGATKAQLHEVVESLAKNCSDADREYRQAIEEEERRS